LEETIREISGRQVQKRMNTEKKGFSGGIRGKPMKMNDPE